MNFLTIYKLPDLLFKFLTFSKPVDTMEEVFPRKFSKTAPFLRAMSWSVFLIMMCEILKKMAKTGYRFKNSSSKLVTSHISPILGY